MLYFPQILSDVLFPLDCDQPQMRVANGSSASHARGEGGGGEEEEKKPQTKQVQVKCLIPPARVWFSPGAAPVVSEEPKRFSHTEIHPTQ